LPGLSKQGPVIPKQPRRNCCLKSRISPASVHPSSAEARWSSHGSPLRRRKRRAAGPSGPPRGRGTAAKFPARQQHHCFGYHLCGLVAGRAHRPEGPMARARQPLRASAELLLCVPRRGGAPGGGGGESAEPILFMNPLNPFAVRPLYKVVGCPLRSVVSSTQLLLVLRPDLARY
jgi:hypothetical protein